MYSVKITERDIAAIELAGGFKLIRHTLEQVDAAIAHLASIFDTEKGSFIRPLTKDENAFITNEMLLCSIDFIYWAERYCWVELDTAKGGLGRLRLWGSQKLLVDEISKIEEEMWAEYDEQVRRGTPEDQIRVRGICIALLKARQLGATTVAQALLMHRAIFSTNLFCLVATVDEDKMGKLWEKPERIFKHLPAWMQPTIKTRNKTEGFKFGDLDVEIARQEGTQKGGMGQGSTPSVVHLTEVAAWPDPEENLQNHLFKAIPWSLRTLVILETTAQGEGNWYERFFNANRRFKSPRWKSVFIPWYAEPGKYRLLPPPGWQPRKDTLLYAKKVWETSEEFMGHKVMLGPEQLYWYEVNKDEAIRDGNLNLFLLNYCATPEEAFRATNVSPFKAEVLDRLSLHAKDPVKILEWDYSANHFTKADLSNLSELEEPRGLLYIYEAPEKNSKYVIGADNARGIVNWNRNTRTTDDYKKDNGALAVVKIGERGKPDVVVATFFAPITPEDLAPIGNRLGRMYHGVDEEMCLQIVETWPSPGTTYQERLITEFGYWNLWRKANINTGQYSRDFGWEANGRTVQDLWVRTKRHIAFIDKKSSYVKFLSLCRHLLREMEHCDEDPKRMTGKAENGYHDDILRATQIAIWGGHDWSTVEFMEEETEKKEAKPKPDFAASDLTIDEMNMAIDDLTEMRG